MSKKYFQIAIDGPVASGKSTASKRVAKKLNFLYIYTGAMYRMATLQVLNKKIDLTDTKQVIEAVRQGDYRLKPSQKKNYLCYAFFNQKNVTSKIFTKKISKKVPTVAKIPEVRRIMVRKQQKIANNSNVVMEGRDITYRVLPNADLKIYLTADVNVRIKRLWEKLQNTEPDITKKEVEKRLVARDKTDKNRKIDPLKIVDDAWVIDSSKKTLEEVVELIVNKVQKSIK